MTAPELRQIVSSAEELLREKGESYGFAEGAVDFFVRVSSGFPWFVHVLGQAALIMAANQGRSRVERQDAVDAANSLVGNRFAQQFSDMYQNAVRDSMQRELVLRAFAEWRMGDIPTADVYRILKEKLGVNNPSAYRGHLTSAEYGSVIFSPAFQSRGLVRFRNEMFKAYVRIRRSIYVGVDTNVREAFGQES